jgi:hypothetical protein
MDEIELNGIKYARVDRPKGNRAVVVVDRGWIIVRRIVRRSVGLHQRQARAVVVQSLGVGC